jgi:hypothetical protein
MLIQPATRVGQCSCTPAGGAPVRAVAHCDVDLGTQTALSCTNNAWQIVLGLSYGSVVRVIAPELACDLASQRRLLTPMLNI